MKDWCKKKSEIFVIYLFVMMDKIQQVYVSLSVFSACLVTSVNILCSCTHKIYASR